MDCSGNYHFWRVESASGGAGCLLICLPAVARPGVTAYDAKRSISGSAGGAFPAYDPHPGNRQSWECRMGG